MSKNTPILIYSCTFRSYDWTFGPMATTPGARFVRFGDTGRDRWRIWEHHPVPGAMVQATDALTNRRMKLFPRAAAGDEGIAVYVDGTILIKTDISPLVDEFRSTGADIGVFAHPSGRNVAEEFDFAARAGKIPKIQAGKLAEQRARYFAAGLLNAPVSENSVIFYKLNSPRLETLSRVWWGELSRYVARDQVALPYALAESGATQHLFDGHFADKGNPFFARYPHKGRVRSWRHAARMKAYHLHPYSAWHGLVYRALQFNSRILHQQSWPRPKDSNQHEPFNRRN